MAASSRRVVITGMGVLTPIGSTVDAYWQSLVEGKSGIRPIRSFDVSSMPTRIAGEIAHFDSKTYITESDAASLLALGEAFRILGRDGADFFLVGGAESKINPVSLMRQCLFEQMSRRNDQPEKACRPFDAARDGLVLGEGSGVFVVE